MKTNDLPDFANDIKSPHMDNEKGNDNMLIRAPPRIARPLGISFLAVALCYFLFTTQFRSTTWRLGCQMKAPETTWQPVVLTKELVPFEAHIMSKCPDARECLRQMILPTMQRVYDKVNFTLSFIGTPTEDDHIACRHGPSECMGNIIELCAANLYPDPKIYLGFTMCLSRDYKDIPQYDLMADCALEHGIDLAKLDECAVSDDGGFGAGMLRDSVRRSTEANVTKSCTVRVNEEVYCIFDNGEVKSCPNGPGVNDLVVAIEKLYRS